MRNKMETRREQAGRSDHHPSAFLTRRSRRGGERKKEKKKVCVGRVTLIMELCVRLLKGVKWFRKKQCRAGLFRNAMALYNSGHRDNDSTLEESLPQYIT